MIKQILRLLFLLAMYELGKYVTEQVYIMMTANDDVMERALIGAAAKDDVEFLNGFTKLSDQSDLMRAEVSE
ncbi:TPA: transcriptional activator RinB [Staphylococcus aureus]